MILFVLFMGCLIERHIMMLDLPPFILGRLLDTGGVVGHELQWVQSVHTLLSLVIVTVQLLLLARVFSSAFPFWGGRMNL